MRLEISSMGVRNSWQQYAFVCVCVFLCFWRAFPCVFACVCVCALLFERHCRQQFAIMCNTFVHTTFTTIATTIPLWCYELLILLYRCVANSKLIHWACQYVATVLSLLTQISSVVRLTNMNQQQKQCAATTTNHNHEPQPRTTTTNHNHNHNQPQPRCRTLCV